MLGRCQVAHTAHYSFWTGKAASSRDGGEDEERYHPSCTHCKGSVDRIPGKRRRDIFAETNSIRFAGRPPRSVHAVAACSHTFFQLAERPRRPA